MRQLQSREPALQRKPFHLSSVFQQAPRQDDGRETHRPSQAGSL